MTKETHEPKIIIDPKTGREKMVYFRTKETQEALEKDRLGKLHMLKPLKIPDLDKRLKLPHLVIITPYLMSQRVILTRLLQDRSAHKIINGTQLLESYLRSQSYLEGFPQFGQLYLQFSYSEAPNRRLADLINEIMGLRYHMDMSCWLLIPRSLTELAGQWGESLLNLSYLPTFPLPSQGGDEVGPNSTAKTDYGPRPNQTTTFSMDDDDRSPDPKFAGRGKKR
jgi:hypothetical protein